MPDATAKYPAASAALADFGGEYVGLPENQWTVDVTVSAGTAAPFNLVVNETISARVAAPGWLTTSNNEYLHFDTVTPGTKTFHIDARAQLDGAVASAIDENSVIGLWLTKRPVNQILAEIIAIETALRGTLTVGNSLANYFSIVGAAAAGQPIISAAGSDTNISPIITSKGTGSIQLRTGAGARLVANFVDIPSSVDYWQIQPSATAGNVRLSAEGTDAAVGMEISSKSVGSVWFTSHSFARAIMQLAPSATAVNYLVASSGDTGNPVLIRSEGTDTNVGFQIFSKGTGSITLYSGSGARILSSFVNTASSVNYTEFVPNVTGGAPVIRTAGTDTNIALFFGAKGTGGHVFLGGLTSRNLLVISDDASGVNYLQITPAPTGLPVTIYSLGSDTNVGLNLVAKGSGAVTVYTGTGASLNTQFVHVASAVNRLTLFGAATTGSPQIGVEGSDTNIGLSLTSKALGAVFIQSALGTRNVGVFASVASSVNYHEFNPATTGNTPYIQANGSDTNVSYGISTKGTGAITFWSGATARVLLQLIDTASSVNHIRIAPNATGAAPEIQAVGSDTNINMTLVPKGTGIINFNYASIAAGGGATATMTGAIGGSGPATANFNAWLRVAIAGTTSYIPFWR